MNVEATAKGDWARREVLALRSKQMAARCRIADIVRTGSLVLR
jgi:hypothetical protein